MSDAASLAVLDYDGTSAFSNPRVLYTPNQGGGAAVAFSSFLPNRSGVVFEVELSDPHGGATPGTATRGSCGGST
jgi:hypothetical protein